MVFSIESNKAVKKVNDLEFKRNVQVVAGDEIIYRLVIQNTGTASGTDMELVDILPYIGDTGVILTDTQRKSEYAIYATSVVTAILSDIKDNVINDNLDIIVEYSQSSNPKRKDSLNKDIGSGIWTILPPSDKTKIRSVKIKTMPNFIFEPNQKITAFVHAKVPVGIKAGKIAYNSFAHYGISLLEPDRPNRYLPAEGVKSGVEVIDSVNSSIGDFVWFDKNKNGIYDKGESGINGVTVELYSEEDKKLMTTMTSNNSNMKAGYYSFNNLKAGNYKVKFIPESQYVLTKQNILVQNGSKPSPTTGFTNIIDLQYEQNVMNIDAGVINKCVAPYIKASNQCIYLGSSFDAMAGVSAYDCADNNITSSVKVIYNDVNTNKEGIYKVIYYVEDSEGKNAQKTIFIKVCEITKRYKSITDIFESVALEQTALSHILNAEGEKIQKANNSNLSINDMLVVNKSVKDTINSVFKLELTLKNKLELFGDCNICYDCCSLPMNTN